MEKSNSSEPQAQRQSSTLPFTDPVTARPRLDLIVETKPATQKAEADEEVAILECPQLQPALPLFSCPIQLVG